MVFCFSYKTVLSYLPHITLDNRTQFTNVQPASQYKYTTSTST